MQHSLDCDNRGSLQTGTALTFRKHGLCQLALRLAPTYVAFKLFLIMLL